MSFPQLSWKYLTRFLIFSPPTVIEGKAYFGSNDSRVYCLDAMSGCEIWVFPTGDAIESSGVVIKDGRAYFCSLDGFIYCVDKENGQLHWKFNTNRGISRSPRIFGNLLLFGNQEGNMYCYDEDALTVRWIFRAEKEINTRADTDGEHVVFGSDDYHTYCLDLFSGEMIWKFLTNFWVQSSPVIRDDRVYFGDSTDLHCLGLRTGSKIWTFGSNAMLLSAPLVDGNIVFFSNEKGSIYCLHALTGKALWEKESESYDNCVPSTPLLSNYGLIYGGYDNRLHNLDPLSGETIWCYKLDDGIFGTPAIWNNRVYVGCQDGYLYCFEL